MEFKNVICNTPEEFSKECQKWAGKSVIRGRKLIAYGEVVAELRNTRGGYREGSGRPQNDRDYAIMVRVSKEAKEYYDSLPNKSEWIDDVLINASKKK